MCNYNQQLILCSFITLGFNLTIVHKKDIDSIVAELPHPPWAAFKCHNEYEVVHNFIRMVNHEAGRIDTQSTQHNFYTVSVNDDKPSFTIQSAMILL